MIGRRLPNELRFLLQKIGFLCILTALHTQVCNGQQQNSIHAQIPDTDKVEFFAGASSASENVFYLPRKFQLSDQNGKPFVITKFILTQDRVDSDRGRQGQVSLGGSAEFFFSEILDADFRRKNMAPVELVWKGISLSTKGPAAFHRYLIEPQPNKLEMNVRMPLNQAEYDNLGIIPSREPETNFVLPAIRVYLVVTDFIELDQNPINVSISPMDWYRAVETWRPSKPDFSEPRQPSKKTSSNSPVSKFQARLSIRNETSLIAFMQHLTKSIRSQSRHEKLPELCDDGLLALHAKLFDKWLIYDLLPDEEFGGQLIFSAQLSEFVADLEKAEMFELGRRVKVHRFRSSGIEVDRSQIELREQRLHGFEHEIDQRIKFVPIGNWEATRVKSVGVEVQLLDRDTGHERQAKLLLAVNQPTDWKTKGRFSESQQLSWRITFAITEEGKIVRPPEPLEWRRDKANLYYDYRHFQPEWVRPWAISN